MRQRLNPEQKSSQHEIHPSQGWLQRKSIDQDSEADNEMDNPVVYKGPTLNSSLRDKSDGSRNLPFVDYSHLKPDPSDLIRERIQQRLSTPPSYVDDSPVKDEPLFSSQAEQTAALKTSTGDRETASGSGGIEDGTVAGGAGENTNVSQDAITISAENPSQILEQLKNTPPTQAFAAYTQAQTVSVQALEKQKQEVQASIPEISAPTGLPAKKTTEVGQESQQAANKAAQGNQSAVDNIEGTPSNQEKSEYDTSVVEVPPAPLPPTTQLAGQETSEEGQQDAQLSRSAQNALNSIQINLDQISPNAGPNPKVDLSGDADPNQVTDIHNQSTQEVQSTKAQAAQAIHQEFGENNIFPEASNETVKANKELTAISPPDVKSGNSPAIPPEVAGQLNQSLSPFLTEKIGVEQDKYKAGKDKFDVDSAQAKTDTNQEIANLNTETKEKQLAEQKQAKSAVAQYRQEWKTELDTVEKDYQEKAGKATTEQGKKIGEEKAKGEKEASQHLEEAEKKVKTEKQTAEREVAQKKEEGQQKSGGFWGWVKSKAKAFIDGIKKAVNFIYDNLRKAVKAIFEAAKQLALAAIDLARKAIVGLIKAYGEILKGLVKIAFAAFPEIAKKINAKIEQAVNKAVEVVNAAADALKKAVTAVLDFLANTLDSLLKLVQDIYNGIFTVIGMIITGEFAELFKRIGNLIDAAKAAPPQFETAGYEELLGGNLDQPLSPIELDQAQAAGINIPGQQGSTTAAPVPESELPTSPWTLENVGVDTVENNMELSPELVADLMQQTNGDGEVMLGESSDRSRSMDSILAEVSGDKHERGETEKQQYPDDRLTPRQRAEIKWELMKQGISQWWSDNWPIVIGAGVLGVVGFIAANIVTGGAITAALPAIMSVVGPLFVGVTIATLAGHIRDYLAKGWEGDIQGGGKSLAKGLAAGAIELISLVTFKAGGAALKGAKAVGKAGVKVAQGAMRAIARGAKYIIEKGKVLFKGIAGTGLGKQFKKLKNLGKGLLDKLRFKAFRIRVKNRRFKLEGLINPWVFLADGSIEQVTFEGQGRAVVGEQVKHGRKNAIVVGIQDTKPSKAVQELIDKAGDPHLIKQNQKLYQQLKNMSEDEIKVLLTNRETTYQLRKGIPGLQPPGFQAHHIVPRELRGNKQIKDFLDELGFDFEDGFRNGIMLPSKSGHGVKGWKNATIHRGSHPQYTARVTSSLETLADAYKMERKGLSPQQLITLSQKYSQKVDQTINKFKQELMSGKTRHLK
ncbi:MAG: AHH domain-containing protein [Crocosphaera sp.]|nr:AHH domain-containing protein [Crocosphaera sp.]